MKFLRLIRIQNLLMLALMQSVFHFGFLKKQVGVLGLDNWQFFLLVLSTICIAGAGYLINDVFDRNIDAVNKPQRVVIGNGISEAMAYNIYVGMNCVGVGIGFYLSNLIEKPGFSAIFIVIAATLYLYASSFKKSLIIGNLVVAIILAVSVLIVGVFDLLPLINPQSQAALAMLFKILIDYAVFAFLINLIREIVKDFEDKEGDLDYSVKSLPIVFGERISKIVVSVLLVLAIGLLMWYNFNYLFENDLFIAVIYVFALILAPLIYTLIRLWGASQKTDYTHLSLILKLIILFGILSILVVSFNIESVKNIG
jgi:4-hydroxybenzoate polyprenyltransferase